MVMTVLAATSHKKANSALPLADHTFYIDELEVPKAKLRRIERSVDLLGGVSADCIAVLECNILT